MPPVRVDPMLVEVAEILGAPSYVLMGGI